MQSKISRHLSEDVSKAKIFIRSSLLPQWSFMNSICISAWPVYLIGLMYWIQATYGGESALFVNRPPNSIKGMMKRGATLVAMASFSKSDDKKQPKLALVRAQRVSTMYCPNVLTVYCTKCTIFKNFLPIFLIHQRVVINHPQVSLNFYNLSSESHIYCMIIKRLYSAYPLIFFQVGGPPG